MCIAGGVGGKEAGTATPEAASILIIPPHDGEGGRGGGMPADAGKQARVAKES